MQLPCSENLYDFHPMYATSSEDTRVVWAAHSYNIAFSDEIGHWEYCRQVEFDNVNLITFCNQNDGVDDFFCFPFLPDIPSSLIPVGGCTFSDVDFDGVSYQLAWPGTIKAFGQDKMVHPSPVRFSSPKFLPTTGGPPQQYNRVAFETNLPGIEPGCDTSNPTSMTCINPPRTGAFYPIYTTTGSPNNCEWQLGGANLPGTKNTFGGSSFVEYGPLIQLLYPTNDPVKPAKLFYEDFRQVLASNPCVSK